MRDFCKVSPKVWRSLKFKKLSDRGRLLYLYLLTCPHANAVGCYSLPLAYVGADIGLDTPADVMAEVEAAGLVRYDDGEGIVFVENFMHFNPPTNASHAAMMLKLAQELKKTPFYKDLIESLQILCQDKDWKGIDTLLRDMNIGCQHPVDTLRTVSNHKTRPDQTQTETRPLPPAARSSPSAAGGGGQVPEVEGPKQIAATLPKLPAGRHNAPPDFDVMALLSEEALEKAKRNAPRWDIAALARKYNAWIIGDAGLPNISVNLAFPAWVLKITGGKPPP